MFFSISNVHRFNKAVKYVISRLLQRKYSEMESITSYVLVQTVRRPVHVFIQNIQQYLYFFQETTSVVNGVMHL